MKICIPVLRSVGEDYQINPDMRNTEALLMVDSITGFEELAAVNASACQAVPDDVDAIICAGGVGAGMFNGWMMRGIRVFSSRDDMVSEALRKLKAGDLSEVGNVPSCGGGCQGHGHGHDHDGGGCQGHAHDHACGCG